MFFSLSKSVDVMLSPLFWTIALIAGGVGWSFRSSPRARRLAWLCPSLGLLILVVFSLEPVANRLWRNLETQATPTVRTQHTYDVVVMLGGIAGGESSESWGATDYGGAVERLLATYDLLRQDRAKFVLISCGSTNPNVQLAIESHLVAAQLERWGIDKNRMIVEDRSRNTRENAIESAAIIRARSLQSVLLVTSAFHSRRACACFRSVGLAFDLLPVDFRSYDPSRFSGSLIPRANSLEQSSVAIREMSGYWIYRLSGYAR